MQTILQHLQQLLSFPSVTPLDAGCQDYMETILTNLGFRCQRLPKNKVSNLYAEIGQSGPRLVFAGHTDVVEAGPLEAWNYPPFELSQDGDTLFGRGIADMKGALAVMLRLAETWSRQAHPGILGFLITSAEEGDDYLDGTPYVMHNLQNQDIKIDYCIVGEPSSSSQVGDSIKIGRRGSLTGRAQIEGKQGHVAYPHLADNALHKALPFLNELSQKNWDQGDAHFPPTTLQITQLQLPTSAANVIPGQLELQFNLRFNPKHSSMSLQTEIGQMALNHQLLAKWQWKTSGEPFLTQAGQLLQITQEVIRTQLGKDCELSTAGGTSDARFIAPFGVEVIELGLTNQSIHQINENIEIQALGQLYELYLNITRGLLHPEQPH